MKEVLDRPVKFCGIYGLKSLRIPALHSYGTISGHIKNQHYIKPWIAKVVEIAPLCAFLWYKGALSASVLQWGIECTLVGARLLIPFFTNVMFNIF